jgi:hypothetical protein
MSPTRPRSVDPSWSHYLSQSRRNHSPHHLHPAPSPSPALAAGGLGFRRPSPLDSGFDSAKTYSPDLSHYSDQSDVYGGMISPVIVSSQMLPTTSAAANSKLVASGNTAVTPPTAAKQSTGKGKSGSKDRPKLSALKEKKPCERLYRSCDRISKEQ